MTTRTLINAKEDIPLNLTGRQSVVFQVQAVNCAAFVLGSASVRDMYLVGFDIGPPNMTGIGKLNSYRYVFNYEAIGTLQGGRVPVWLWVYWRDERIITGFGNVLGKNYILQYHDLDNPTWTNNISRLNVYVQGLSDGNWTFPYDQGPANPAFSLFTVENTLNNSVFDTSICKDSVSYEGSFNTSRIENFMVTLEGRNSIKFRVDNYRNISYINFTSETNSYMVNHATLSVKLSRGPVNLGIHVIPAYLVNVTPLYVWASWKDQMFVYGFGNVIGQQELLVYNISETPDIKNITANMTGIISFPFPYFFSTTALARPPPEQAMMQKLKFLRLATDKCLDVCSSDLIPNPSCRWMVCAVACMEKANCTAFCLRRQPSQLTSCGSCECELYGIPGKPSPDLFRNETGSMYYQIS